MGWLCFDKTLTRNLDSLHTFYYELNIQPNLHLKCELNQQFPTQPTSKMLIKPAIFNSQTLHVSGNGYKTTVDEETFVESLLVNTKLVISIFCGKQNSSSQSIIDIQ